MTDVYSVYKRYDVPYRVKRTLWPIQHEHVTNTLFIPLSNFESLAIFPSQNGETPLHISVRYCHWEVGDELLTFTTNWRTRLDAVMLVNQANAVSPEISPVFRLSYIIR